MSHAGRTDTTEDIKILKNSLTAGSKSQTDEYTVSERPNATEIEIIYDEYIILPNAGGPGNQVYYITGCALAALSVISLAAIRRRNLKLSCGK